MTRPAITYLRVSTTRQGQSGLGLDAQRSAIESFAAQNGYALGGEYLEIETGKGHDALARRPKLKAALAHAKKLKGPVIVAKLDRLGRNVSFISTLMEKRVDFVVTELGEVPPYVLHFLATIAEMERNTIAERTKAALAAAKRRGVKLGKHGKVLARLNKAKANETAEHMAPIIAELRAAGIVSMIPIADELNRRGIKTPRGYAWNRSTVSVLLRRIDGKIK